MARVALPESKIRARRKRVRTIVATLVVVAALSVLASLVWLSHASFLRITSVEVSGEQTISSSSIMSIVQSNIAGAYGYLFAKNNIFLYPRSTIDEMLTTNLPAIASAQVHAVNFHTIEVSIIERQPKALWCGAIVDASSSNCLLLDQYGVAYGPADSFSFAGQLAGTYKHYFGALTGSTTPQHYLTPALFSSLGALVDTVAQSQPQDAVTSVSVDQYQDVRVGFASGFTLLFPLSADGGDVYQRFTLALKSDAFSGHKIADFQYLDLRFGDRLYYKLK